VDIANKWALVTGASRGVGQQIALGLAELGVNLVLHSSSKSNQSTTKALLGNHDVQVHSIEGLLDDSSAIRSFVEEAESLSGGIDILYNNAALMTPETALFDTPRSDYEKSFQVNLYSVIQICAYFAPRMVSRGFGRIVNVTSGIKDTPRLDAYSLTKAALDKYTRDLAIELEGSGVLANMLDPGWCRTDMGGQAADNPVESVLPGALIPAMLGKEGKEAPKGKLFAAQEFAGIKWRPGSARL
jgi:NAD(P)-dependent dehydrogenase (short-subunit alcohol dehydrogenase family)